MRNTVRLLVLGFAGFSSVMLGGARPAAAEPNTMAKNQIYYALGHCEAKAANQYFAARDRAYAADASIKTFSGTLFDKAVSKEKIAQCDRDMGEVAEQAKRSERIAALALELDQICFRLPSSSGPEVTKAQALRAQLATELAASKGSYKGSKPQEANSTCDRKIAELKASEAQKREADAKRVADDAARAAYEKKSAAAASATKARSDAAVAALKGDRAKVFKEYGMPEASNSVDAPARLRAARWQYTIDVQTETSYDEYGESNGSKSSPCTHRFDFSGDKLVKHGKSGAGCAHE